MSRGTYRAVNFDLKTKAMQNALGSKTKGYRLIRKSMADLGFSHRQGSGYRSDMPMTKPQVDKFVGDLGKQNPWLATCVGTFDITSSGRKGWDYSDDLRNAAASAAAGNATQTDVADVFGSNQPVQKPSLLNMVANMPHSSAGSGSTNANTSSSENVNE